MSIIVVDIECVPLDNAQDYLEPIPDAVLDESPIEPAKNLVDPFKIAADIRKRAEARAKQNAEAVAAVEKARADRLDRLGLDWNVGRICAIGWWVNGESSAYPCRDWEDERELLAMFWERSRHRTIVGFKIREFDICYLIQRSRYLKVNYPQLDLAPWRRNNLIDLYDDLTFGQKRSDNAYMRRTLHSFCRRFGIPVNDDIKGSDIPALIAAGDYESAVKHVKSDVELTVALAKVLGVVKDHSAAEVF